MQTCLLPSLFIPSGLGVFSSAPYTVLHTLFMKRLRRPHTHLPPRTAFSPFAMQNGLRSSSRSFILISLLIDVLPTCRSICNDHHIHRRALATKADPTTRFSRTFLARAFGHFRKCSSSIWHTTLFSTAPVMGNASLDSSHALSSPFPTLRYLFKILKKTTHPTPRLPLRSSSAPL